MKFKFGQMVKVISKEGDFYRGATGYIKDFYPLKEGDKNYTENSYGVSLLLPRGSEIAVGFGESELKYIEESEAFKE